MNNSKISVILPVYNVDKYLNKCIDSILDQTFNNFELIIIDDGSTDNSGNIIEEYKNIDNRIKVIHQTNKGLSYSRNIGIELSKGKYITFIDSDDFIDSKYLEILYSLITKYDADIAMCDYINIKDNNKNIKALDIYNEEIISKEEVYKRIMLNKGLCFMAWSKLYKKSIFNNIKFPINKYFEDMYIINDIVESTNKIVVTNYNGYYYLKRKNSISKSKMSNRHLDLLDATNIYKEFMYKNYSNLNIYTNKVLVLNYYIIYNKAIFNKEYKQLYTDLRHKILKYKKEIFKSNIYAKKEKIQTILLLLGNIIYKIIYKCATK